MGFPPSKKKKKKKSSDASAKLYRLTRIFSASDGDIERVKMLLDKGHDPSAKDSEGWPPLQYAIENHHTSVCEILLEYGADVEGRTAGETTPLHRAATQGHTETVRILLRHGANANLKDADGKTALHRAISSHASSRETLQNSSSSNTCILLLQHSDPNIKDNTGRTTKELISQKYKEALSKFGSETMKNSFLAKWFNKDIDLGESSKDKKSLQNKQTLEEELKAMDLGKELEKADKKFKKTKIKRLAREHQPKESALEEIEKSVDASKQKKSES